MPFENGSSNGFITREHRSGLTDKACSSAMLRTTPQNKRAAYAELQVASNFSFLRGASHPEEIMQRAADLGLTAVAITDLHSLAGVVRAHQSRANILSRKNRSVKPPKLIIGARLDFHESLSIIALVRNRKAYGYLCRLLTLGKRRSEKGKCLLHPKDIVGNTADIFWLAIAPDPVVCPKAEWRDFSNALARWRELVTHNLRVIISPHNDGRDPERWQCIKEEAQKYSIPLVATNNVIMHVPKRRMLADVLSCVRHKCTIHHLGRHAQMNAERHLKSPQSMADLFSDYQQAIEETCHIAHACNFSLDELRYEYPHEISPDGEAPQERLERLARARLDQRYTPGPTPLNVRELMEKELALIRKLNYAPYFLTVFDVVTFARNHGILCQGRGSAANSVVCYALGVTSIKPEIISMVFERFVSEARNEPPDIDVDFEHERREEVIQHIYQKYGRHRAGICSTVVHYRRRYALREVGRVMGLSEDNITAISKQITGWGSSISREQRLRELGLNPGSRILRRTLALADELVGFPRHLSQHVGGFVITAGRLDELCPIENARMKDRTVIEWDKDDIDALGILKIDVLALGMLSCIRKALQLINSYYPGHLTLHSLPPDDPKVYEMLGEADTVGVFQVESRAQMSFLPRMKPRNFYDLVIEVAIVRPGPIQGDMVHPYLRRRRGEESVSYPSDELKAILHKTLGVPLFQEQAMQIAQVAAGFSLTEADQLRRAMATFRNSGTLGRFREKFIAGMLKRGYAEEFAIRCFSQIEGFGEYGFPESHAASFALLVYASAWIKHHHPAIFACALLNSQPMGFYGPAQIIRDAKNHGVEVRPICVNHSKWDNSIEYRQDGQLALRLGFRQLRGFHEEDAHWLVAARGNGYQLVDDLCRRAGLGRSALLLLAQADALHSLNLDRRGALWSARAMGSKTLPLFECMHDQEWLTEAPLHFPPMSEGQKIMLDYHSTHLSLGRHPLALIRADLLARYTESGCPKNRNKRQRYVKPALIPAKELINIPGSSRNNVTRTPTNSTLKPPQNMEAKMHHHANGKPFWISVAGLVICRQRPHTASGVVFLTLEDEGGVANVVIWQKVYERYRKVVVGGRLLLVSGRVERDGSVIHLIATYLEDHSDMLDRLYESESCVSRPQSIAGPATPQQLKSVLSYQK